VGSATKGIAVDAVETTVIFLGRVAAHPTEFGWDGSQVGESGWGPMVIRSS